jgi:Ca2+-transporting ATPase
LFPVILLFVTAASYCVDRDRAGRTVVGFLESYAPMSAEMQRLIFSTISGMVDARGRADAAALLILAWTASQVFATIICATNRAWGVVVNDWWHLPLKSMVLLGVGSAAAPAVLAASTLARLAVRLLPAWMRGAEGLAFPTAAQFIALAVLYRFAPRRPTRFSEVWSAALIAALLLRAAAFVFELYLHFFSASNAVYGAFGGIMALLLWIYLSGCVFIFGACWCAAGAEPPPGPGFAGPAQ